MAEGKSHSNVRKVDRTELMQGSNVQEGSWEMMHLCYAPTSVFLWLPVSV